MVNKKTVLVTGSAKGIGKELIIKFAKKGYNVVINYLSSKEEALKLKKLVEKEYDVKALAIKADISNEDEVINMVKEIKDKFSKIDVLINNAAYTCDNNYKDKTKKEFMKVLEVNVVGTFLVTKYASDIMNDGVVINVSSRDSLDTYNELSMDYCASKAAVNLLCQTFSQALSNIRFLSILLPWVNTESIREMFPEYLESELKRIKQKRLLETYEVSDIIYNYVNDKKIKSGSIIKIENP